MFCTSSHDALHVCEFLSKYLKIYNLQSWYEHTVEIAISNIYYVQRVLTPKVG